MLTLWPIAVSWHLSYLLMMGHKTRNSIRSFWRGKLTRAEARRLLEDLDTEGSELRRQIETEFAHEDAQELLSPEQSDELLKAVRQKTGIGGRPVRRLNPYRWVGAAAAVLLFGLFAVFYNMMDARRATSLSEQVADLSRTFKIATAHDSLRYVLADGSVVLLSPFSAIFFDSGYTIDNRDIQLIGEGKFSVRKDSTLAFKVAANGFTTTALGTEFIVDARKISTTTVRLLSGKVVVRSEAEKKAPSKEVYLAAGEMVRINEIGEALVSNFVDPPTPTVRPSISKTRIAASTTSKAADLRFERDDLEKVIQQITAKFDTPIFLEKGVLKHLTFTGEFSEQDDLETILATICLVNDLQYSIGPGNRVYIRLKDPIAKNESDSTNLEPLNSHYDQIK